MLITSLKTGEAATAVGQNELVFALNVPPASAQSSVRCIIARNPASVTGSDDGGALAYWHQSELGEQFKLVKVELRGSELVVVGGENLREP